VIRSICVRLISFGHLTYTSQYFLYGPRALDLAGAHSWTLSVEEQFYLVWASDLIPEAMAMLRRMLLPCHCRIVAGGAFIPRGLHCLGYHGPGVACCHLDAGDQLGVRCALGVFQLDRMTDADGAIPTAEGWAFGWGFR